MSAADRRTFVRTLGALSGMALLRPAESAALAAVSQGQWDLTWIDALKGKHRQVFDFGSRNLGVGRSPLRVPRNYLNAFRDVYAMADKDINTIVAIAYEAFPMNAGDALYEKFPIGERWQIKDPATGQWARRNIWLDTNSEPADATVKSLQSRGTIFWQCNNAFAGVVSEIAMAVGRPAPAVREELLAGFNRGVKMVPAHTMLLGLVQERGFTYEKI